GAFRRIARRAGVGAFLPSPAPCQGARSRGGRTEAIRWGPIVGPGTPFVRRIHRFFATVALAACVAGTTAAADRITGKPFATRSEVHAPHAMAATSHPLATQVALEVMKAGGSAVDAAIAANAALGLMEPTGNGIGATCSRSSGTRRRAACTATTARAARRVR